MPLLDALYAKFNGLSPRQQAFVKNGSVILIICIVISSVYDHQQAEQAGTSSTFSPTDIIAFPIVATFRFFNRIFFWIFNFFYGLIMRFGVASEDFNRFIKSAGSIFVFLFKQIYEFFYSFFEFIETILTAPIQIILNFSQFVEKFLSSFSQIFIILYRILMAIIHPIWELIKATIPYILKIFKLPLIMFSKFGLFLRDVSKSLYDATKKTAGIVMNGLLIFIRKLSHLSFSVIFDSIRIPIQAILNFLKMIYNKFSIFPFIKKVIHVISKLPYYLYRAIVDLSIFLYRGMINFFTFCIEMSKSMLQDVIEALKITKYLPEFLHPIVNFFYEIGKFILDILLKIVVLPYRFVVFLINALIHPIQTLMDTLYSIAETIRSAFLAIAHFFESGIFNLILSIIKAPYNLVKKLTEMISFRFISNILRIPLNAIEYFFKGIKHLLNLLINSLISISKAIVNGLVNVVSLVRYFSLSKLIYYLLSPIRFILKVIEDLSSIPFAGYLIRLIRIILYIPIWLISFIFRFIYFFLESFMNFFSKNFTLKNIFDMWDNVCWPRDAEYCKQILEEQSAKNIHNNYNSYANYNDDYADFDNHFNDFTNE
ncbi:hypothetical protein TRFO_07125 [Tritrichomonas foetus]|uniref:Uncharacterized protein n=1 Tax=Tritrichomonas foetus TaxID=1144522 RepID=A0A1J4JT65_9EUKA|nr:hypothetical protein TRFO_07125 [Tritrichomonas foetus]|eukprot:OHT02311.1 hypothetical protein TRFO_07125 [Tritrichomonas foetus]